MAGMVADLEFVPERMRAAAAAGHATATDLADWLVGEADVPFREAHHIAGRAVAAAEAAGKALDELTLDELQAIDPRIDERGARRAFGRSLGRVAPLGWRDRARPGSRSDRRGARRCRRERNDEAASLLAVRRCCRARRLRQASPPLEPPPGQPLPVKPAHGQTTPDRRANC